MILEMMLRTLYPLQDGVSQRATEGYAVTSIEGQYSANSRDGDAIT